MSENFISIPQTAKITDEYAAQKDKRKAYQIFILSGISAVILTGIMFFIQI